MINLLGSLFMSPAASMFDLVDGLVEEAREQARVIVVDVHAEATSEKVALAHWLDGKVTAVLGTHTHVQTSDARVQRGGTAALTDVGMTGPHDSVIGVKTNLAIHRMRTGMPVRFETAEGGVRIEGALVDCDESGRATAIEAVRVDFPDEDDEQRDEDEVADQHERRGQRVELAREVPVARREPELRHDERERQQRRGAQAAPPGDERDDGHEPDQELRREHLPERDEGDERGRAPADELLARRRAAAARSRRARRSARG